MDGGSPALLGRQIDDIWHTGIVVHGQEYYFGGGIQVGYPGGTHFGRPVQVIPMGETHIPEELLDDDFDMDDFDPEDFDLEGIDLDGAFDDDEEMFDPEDFDASNPDLQVWLDAETEQAATAAAGKQLPFGVQVMEIDDTEDG